MIAVKVAMILIILIIMCLCEKNKSAVNDDKVFNLDVNSSKLTFLIQGSQQDNSDQNLNKKFN